MVKKNLRVLVCPLNWGIGHATRCVPIIRRLQEEGHEVIIAADGLSFDFLREYFKDFKMIRYPGFRIRYPKGKKMILKMTLQLPVILSGIFSEHRRLKKIIAEIKPDVVISDNRFGAWSEKVHSIYMTHQVMIKAPGKRKFAEPILHRLHGWILRHYDECWIPDLPGEINLSGDLSHKYPVPENAKFIGLLSRFEKDRQLPTANRQPLTADRRPPTADHQPSPDLLVLLSGPEPQRTVFENIVLKELEKHRGLHAVILQGLPGERKEQFPAPGVVVLNHLPDKALADMIKTARIIVCRPGYSTLMDLAALGRNAVLVATPGQTEQEYLAESLASKGTFFSIQQNSFNLSQALDKGLQLNSNLSLINDQSLLDDRIAGLKG